MHADDCTTFLDGQENSLIALLNLLKHFHASSGLELNVDKTKVMWIGSKAGSKEKLRPDLNLNWILEGTLNILGISIAADGTDFVSKNYEEKLKDVKKLLNCWAMGIQITNYYW